MNVESGYDLFISHASEDKDTFVRPLVSALKASGIKVWYDEFSLKPGDSLRESIDRGLATSRHGLVVLSKEFIKKKWTNWEVNGLVQMCLEDSARRIIPLWLDVDLEDVKGWSPPVADLVAIKGSDPILVAEKIAEAIDSDDVTYFRLRLSENIDLIRTIKAMEACVRLLFSDSTGVSYALYRVERKSLFNPDSLYLIHTRGHKRFIDNFRLRVPWVALAPLYEIDADYPIIDPSSPVFDTLVHRTSSGGESREALLLVPLLSYASPTFSERPSVELLIAFLAPENRFYQSSDRATTDLAVILGAMFQPYFGSVD